MFSEKVKTLLNEQITKEFYSAYLYLDFANYYEEQGLKGFAHWFTVQAQEERDHALLFIKYMQNNDIKVTLEAIGKPDVVMKKHIDALCASLTHEQFVTASIHALAETSEKAKDRSAVGFLDWFIKEQVEEEKNASRILGQLKLFGEVPQAVYMLDQELKARVFALPADIPITPV